MPVLLLGTLGPAQKSEEETYLSSKKKRPGWANLVEDWGLTYMAPKRCNELTGDFLNPMDAKCPARYTVRNVTFPKRRNACGKDPRQATRSPLAIVTLVRERSALLLHLARPGISSPGRRWCNRHSPSHSPP